MTQARTYHPGLAGGRWQQLSLAEQLGNIGSEVHRAIRGRGRADEQSFRLAVDRSLELMDLTIADPRWQTGRRELTRTREILCDFLIGQNTYRSTSQNLEKYFDQFAFAARRAHEQLPPAVI